MKNSKREREKQQDNHLQTNIRAFERAGQIIFFYSLKTKSRRYESKLILFILILIRKIRKLEKKKIFLERER